MPDQLEVDEFEGSSWVGVVPFRMEGVTRRPLPPMPWISAFPELNLRLYVSDGDRPGVWFLSLDAGNPIAVWAAQTLFHLPYHWAAMGARERSSGIHYRSRRRLGPEEASFDAVYAPAGEPYRARKGTLEHWLTERYCLYARSRRGRLYRGEVHHEPWPLQPATAEIRVNELARPHGLRLEGAPALLHFSRAIEVAVWPLVRVG